jgi:hypothetical protein
MTTSAFSMPLASAPFPSRRRMKSGTMALDSLKRLRDDTDGAAFLEFTVFAMFFFTLLFGIVEFTLAYYQWNAGTKAVQLGARLAAVSNPVSDELAVASWDLADYAPGDIVAIDDGFTIVCTGADGGRSATVDSALQRRRHEHPRLRPGQHRVRRGHAAELRHVSTCSGASRRRTSSSPTPTPGSAMPGGPAGRCRRSGSSWSTFRCSSSSSTRFSG